MDNLKIHFEILSFFICNIYVMMYNILQIEKITQIKLLNCFFIL